MTPDVIVIGAGICGASAAYFLAQYGVSVVVVEQSGIAQATTARGEGLVLVCDKPPGPERDLALTGRALWKTLGEQFPEARVRDKDALLLGPQDGHATLDVEPELLCGTTTTLAPGELQVDAVAMAQAMLNGIPVHQARVSMVEPGQVILDDGRRMRAGHVVVAAGPWSRELTGLPVEPRKGHIAALVATTPLISHSLVEALYLESVADEDPERSIASVIVQSLDGDEIFVGSSRERVGDDDTIDPTVIDAIIERAIRFVPALAGRPVTRAWCGFRPWLPDHLPAIGQLAERLWTTTGHEGAGVCLGPVSGLLLAQLICGEEPIHNAAPFDPQRF